MNELDQIIEEVCEGCDGRGRCPDRPCVKEADEPDWDFRDPADDLGCGA